VNQSRSTVHVVHADGVRLCHWTAATNGPIIHPPGDKWVWRATVEWYSYVKAKELKGKPVQVPLCPVQSPYGLTRASAVTGQQLTAWAMVQPSRSISKVTGYELGGQSLIPSGRLFLLATKSIPPKAPTQPLIKWFLGTKELKCEANHSPSYECGLLYLHFHRMYNFTPPLCHRNNLSLRFYTGSYCQSQVASDVLHFKGSGFRSLAWVPFNMMKASGGFTQCLQANVGIVS
jgi:hypothetical protein